MSRHISSRRFVATAAAVLAAAGLLASCGSSQKSESASGPSKQDLKLSLDWSTAVPYHAPFALASADGIWAKHGLNVTETYPAGSGAAVVEVGSGKTDMAWADLSTAAASMLQKVPITAVAKVQDKNASGLTFLKGTNFSKASDIVGMSIGSTPGGSDSTLIGAFLNANGIKKSDVKVENMPANGKFAALMSGKIDAISGQVYYYVSSAEAQGKEAFGVSYSDMGLDVLDHGFVAADSFIKSHPDEIKSFLAAYREALQKTIADPVTACKDLVAQAKGAVKQADCEAQLKMWLPLTTSPTDPHWGANDASGWTTTVDVLKKYGGATGSRAPETMFDNDFLPGGN